MLTCFPEEAIHQHGREEGAKNSRGWTQGVEQHSALHTALSTLSTIFRIRADGLRGPGGVYKQIQSGCSLVLYCFACIWP